MYGLYIVICGRQWNVISGANRCWHSGFTRGPRDFDDIWGSVEDGYRSRAESPGVKAMERPDSGVRLRCDDALGDDIYAASVTSSPSLGSFTSHFPLSRFLSTRAHCTRALSQEQRAPLLITPCLLSDVHTCLRNILLRSTASVSHLYKRLWAVSFIIKAPFRFL